MLKLIIPAFELFDDEKQEFIKIKEQVLQLEHSLVSLSKWESKWCKPFLTKEEKTPQETVDYIRCMTLTQNVNPNVYLGITNENIDLVNAYIEAPMTATKFPKERESGRREIVTAEIIYHWMIAATIPFECQKWHLNRLLALVRVCGLKNQPDKKMSQGDIMRRNAELNAARRQALNTKG